MAYIITSLCLRDSACVDVCPCECIVGGQPQSEWPWYYIDPEPCIDCGACVPECPYEAIFHEMDVPKAYTAKGGEVVSMPVGTPGFDQTHESHDKNNQPVQLAATRTLTAGEVVDLTPDIQTNTDFYLKGPGYEAL